MIDLTQEEVLEIIQKRLYPSDFTITMLSQTFAGIDIFHSCSIAAYYKGIKNHKPMFNASGCPNWTSAVNQLLAQVDERGITVNACHECGAKL